MQGAWRERHDASPVAETAPAPAPVPKPEADIPQDRADAGKALTNPAAMDETRRVLEELKLENQRLRKIVTDLLLEKMRLEEAAVAGSSRQSGTQGVIQALFGPANSR